MSPTTLRHLLACNRVASSTQHVTLGGKLVVTSNPAMRRFPCYVSPGRTTAVRMYRHLLAFARPEAL